MATQLQDFVAAKPDAPVVVQTISGLALDSQASLAKTLRVVIYKDNEFAYFLRLNAGAVKYFSVYGKVVTVDSDHGIVQVALVPSRQRRAVTKLIRNQEAIAPVKISVDFAQQPAPS